MRLLPLLGTTTADCQAIRGSARSRPRSGAFPKTRRWLNSTDVLVKHHGYRGTVFGLYHLAPRILLLVQVSASF